MTDCSIQIIFNTILRAETLPDGVSTSSSDVVIQNYWKISNLFNTSTNTAAEAGNINSNSLVVDTMRLFGLNITAAVSPLWSNAPAH